MRYWEFPKLIYADKFLEPPHGDVVSNFCKILMSFLSSRNIEGPVYFPWV